MAQYKKNKGNTSQDSSGLISKISALVGRWGAFLETTAKSFENSAIAYENSIKKLLNEFNALNSAVSSFSKVVGQSSKAMDQMQKNLTKVQIDKQLGLNFGVSIPELTQQIQNIYRGNNRRLGIDNESVEDIAATRSIYGEQVTSDFINRLDEFGLGIQDASKIAGDFFKDASKSGLNLQVTSKNFLDNVKKAQTYTFKEGVKGVEKMAKLAAETKINIADAVRFSEKIMTLEGSLETGAALQALGGSFSTFSNPLALLNMANSSIEEVQETMVNMIKDMGTFNKKTGEVDVANVDKRRIRIAAREMGVSYDTLMDAAHNEGRKDEIRSQINSRNDLSEEMKKLIINTATFKDGKAGITDTEGNFRELSSLSNADQKKLEEQMLALNRTEGEDIKEIAKNLRTITDIFEGNAKDLQAHKAKKQDKKGKEQREKVKNRNYDDFNKLRADTEYSSNRHEYRVGMKMKVAGYTSDAISSGANVLTNSSGSKMAEGGEIKGPSHDSGGVKAQVVSNGNAKKYELEGGEYIINKHTTKEVFPLLEAINNEDNPQFFKTLSTLVNNSVSINNSKNRSNSGNSNIIKENHNIENITNFADRSKTQSFLYSQIKGIKGIDSTLFSKLLSFKDRVSGTKLLKNIIHENIINSTLETFFNGGNKVSSTNNSFSNIDKVGATAPIKPDVTKLSPEVVSPQVNPQQTADKAVGVDNITISPVEVKFSGTIKVEGKNGASVDITQEFLENKNFIRKITEEIEKQINYNKYGKDIKRSSII